MYIGDVGQRQVVSNVDVILYTVICSFLCRTAKEQLRCTICTEHSPNDSKLAELVAILDL